MEKQSTYAKRRPSPLKYPLIALLGGVGYWSIEMLYRGRSHWSMAMLGGICLVLMYLENRWLTSHHIILRAACCALTVTVLEFLAGCILNLWLGWQIWDYRALPFNLFGQISPLFSFLWFLLSLPVCYICSAIEKKRV